MSNYIIEGLAQGQWSTQNVADTDEAVTFGTREEAEEGLWELVRVFGCPEDELRIAEQDYTARITATGADSTVPDNETAVDAEISLGSKVVGEVTLLQDHTGQLSTWGQGLDHWADDAMCAHLGGAEDSDRAIDEIVHAVRVARMAARSSETFVRYRCDSHLNDHNVAIYRTSDGRLRECVEHLPSDQEVSHSRFISEGEAQTPLTLRGLARVMTELEDLD